MYIKHLYNVMTKTNKDVLINFRVREDIRDDFKIVADLRGSTLSGLLHQYMVKTIREEKDRDSKAFEANEKPNQKVKKPKQVLDAELDLDKDETKKKKAG